MYSATKYRIAKFFKFHKIMDHLFYCPLFPTVEQNIYQDLLRAIVMYTEVIDY